MTANHDQAASCKILIGGKREKKESKTITKKFATAKRTPPANNRLRSLTRARIRFVGRGFSRDIKCGDRKNYRLRCLTRTSFRLERFSFGV
jgi:hypothetical protein